MKKTIKKKRANLMPMKFRKAKVCMFCGRVGKNMYTPAGFGKWRCRNLAPCEARVRKETEELNATLLDMSN